jgi:16S rRNA C967 or C1407 C5-methylase (RsmB/RsmF family)
MHEDCAMPDDGGASSEQIYGIDASSGAAVVALDPQPGDNVLDLCCAPGA